MQGAQPDLTGVHLKLARARAHIDAIRDMVAAFVDADPPPFGFRVEKRPVGDGGVDYTLYAIVRAQPPRDFGPLIGDAVHNIRSALDHLVYELAPAKARKGGRAQFPIFTDECQYRVLGEPIIQGIAGDERTLIERVQPWNASAGAPEQNPLAVLARLSNLDKHRLLVPVITEVAFDKVSVSSSNAKTTFTFVKKGAVADGDRIVAFSARPTGGGDMVIQPQSGLQITLASADTRVPWNRSLDELLTVLHHHVDRDVIDMWFKYGVLPPRAERRAGA